MCNDMEISLNDNLLKSKETFLELLVLSFDKIPDIQNLSKEYLPKSA